MKFKTTQHIPLTKEQEAQYEDEKAEDYKADMNSFLSKYVPSTEEANEEEELPDERVKIIMHMRGKGLTHREISEMIGLSRGRISQILGKWVNG